MNFPWSFPNASRRGQIIRLATPIILGMISVNILDLVDTAMIGRLGDKALAATGFGSLLFFASFSACIGLGAGIQTLTARRLKNPDDPQFLGPLYSGLFSIILYSLILSPILYGLAPKILSLFTQDSTVLAMAIDYYRWRIVGMIAIGISIGYRGFWNGLKQPNIYTTILIATHSLNILFNWVLIFGNLGFPQLGVKGAAMGSTAALSIGALVYIFYSNLKRPRPKESRFLFSKDTLRTMLKLSIPTCIDQALFAFNLLALFWVFGQLGTTATAIAHVVITSVLILWLPGMGFGMASMSLVSEALGNGNPDDAKRWGWDVTLVSTPLIMGIGLFLFFFPELILSQFIHNPDTLRQAIFPFRLDTVTLWAVCIGNVFMESLKGAGDTRRVMLINVLFRWGILLPGVYIVGITLGYGLNGLWLFWASLSAVQSLIFLGLWQRDRWKQIQL